MNKVIEMGRMTATPELKTTPNGISVCSFTIAVNRPGNKETTDFLDCVAWRYTAEFICKWFEKGSPIIVEGFLQSRTYEDKNGQKRKVAEIVADNVFFVPRAKENKNEAALDISGTPASYSAGSDSDFMEVEDEDMSF